MDMDIDGAAGVEGGEDAVDAEAVLAADRQALQLAVVKTSQEAAQVQCLPPPPPPPPTPCTPASPEPAGLHKLSMADPSRVSHVFQVQEPES